MAPRFKKTHRPLRGGFLVACVLDMEKAWLKCIKCGQVYPLTKDILTCPRHSQYYGYLTILYHYDTVNQFPGPGNSWKRYLSLPLLPVKDLKVNFNEEKTPLIKLERFGSKIGAMNLYCKDESKNPTGSFKDKESAIAVNKAVEWGIDKLFVVSSGNAAVSTAAYAQKAGIICECLVPKNLSLGKRFLISLYGGKLKEFPGPYETIYRMAIDEKYPGWNATPGINPLKDEGIKTIGFEIWEEIGTPDIIVVPCGNGSLLFGLYKAFAELLILGRIKKLPKFVGIQVRGAAPLKAAFDQRREWVALSSVPESIAEGIVALESYASAKVVKVLKEVGGFIIEVDDSQIKQAMKEIIQLEGLLPEPTAAAVFAGVKKLNISKKVTVCIQTAGGQKNLKEIMESYFV